MYTSSFIAFKCNYSPPFWGGVGGEAVIFSEVFVSGWQLMAHKRGEQMAELHEELFAWQVVVGLHVERGVAQGFELL